MGSGGPIVRRPVGKGVPRGAPRQYLVLLTALSFDDNQTN